MTNFGFSKSKNDQTLGLPSKSIPDHHANGSQFTTRHVTELKKWSAYPKAPRLSAAPRRFHGDYVAAPRWLRRGSVTAPWRFRNVSEAALQRLLILSEAALLWLLSSSVLVLLRPWGNSLVVPQWLHGSSVAALWIPRWSLGRSTVIPRRLHGFSKIALWWIDGSS